MTYPFRTKVMLILVGEEDNLQLSKDNNDIGVGILVVTVGQHWYMYAAGGFGLFNIANLHVSLIFLIFLDVRI